MTGRAGDDLLWGSAGHDFLKGNDGNDKLRGDLGRDILDGGTGRNCLWGGRGNDCFVLSNKGIAVVEDFQNGNDTIVLKGNMKFEDLKILQQGNNTVIKCEDHLIAHCKGIASGILTASNFTYI